jgi:hypothetical protein
MVDEEDLFILRLKHKGKIKLMALKPEDLTIESFIINGECFRLCDARKMF